MRIGTQQEAEALIYRSYLRAQPHVRASHDRDVRRPELTRELLASVGSPNRGGRFALVTGSKGKGSTARMLSSLLSHMGYKVGLFTSPHYVHFNERIRIDGRAISESDMIRYANAVADGFERIERRLAPDEYQGPVGIALAIAALYFRERETDFNVIECGRGGLYDDTNVLDNEWAVVTPIMEEHVKQLGPTLEDIALQKLGIVKDATKRVYLGKQRAEMGAFARERLARWLEERPGRAAFHYGDDYVTTRVEASIDGVTFDARTPHGEYRDIALPMLGEFQAFNASLAIVACEDIAGRALERDVVERCFSRLRWPGRCEIAGRDPLVLLDGAIHRDSAAYVADVVRRLNPDGARRVAVIVGVPRDKDYEGVIAELGRVANDLVVTKPDISHLAFPDDALSVARRYVEASVETPYLKDALRYVRETVRPDIVLVVGTQIFIGNAKRELGQSLLDIGK